MSRYLRQTPSGDIYHWTALLAARADMEEIPDPFVTVDDPMEMPSALETENDAPRTKRGRPPKTR